MVINVVYKGVFIWKNMNGEKTKDGYLTLSTDDMLLATNSTKASTLLEQQIGRYFIYTRRNGLEILFLNFRII